MEYSYLRHGAIQNKLLRCKKEEIESINQLHIQRNTQRLYNISKGATILPMDTVLLIVLTIHP